MRYESVDRLLKVRLIRDLNLLTARRIRALAASHDDIEIDLSASKFVDTEGLRMLNDLQRAGKQITLKKPPPLFYEALRILELEDVLDPDRIVVDS